MLLPLIVAGAGFLGNLFGQSQSAAANNRAFDNLTKRRNELTSSYNVDYNKDFMDTTESRSAMKRYQDSMSKIKAGIGNTAVKTGATPESVVATGARMNDSYAGFLNNLAGQATRYKQNIKNRYEARMDGLDNQEQSILGQKGKDWINFGDNVSNAASGLLSAWALGGNDKVNKTKSPFDTKDVYDINNMGNGNVSQ